LSAVLPVHAAGPIDRMQCDVAISQLRDGVATLTYETSFQVAQDAPYEEDFSSPTRLRFFKATLSADAAGVPVVSFSLDADVGVFDSVLFGSELKVTDKKGSSTSGFHEFFTSVQGTQVSHSSSYTLSCAKAR